MENANLPVSSDQAVAITAARCREILIAGQDDLTAANELLKGIKALRLEIDREFDPGIREAFEHHRNLVAQKRKFTDPLDQAEKTLKPKITAYLLEQDRLAQEAARREEEAQAKMRKVADKASDEAYETIKNGDLDEADKIVAEASSKIEQIQAGRAPMPEKPVALGTSLRKVWRWEIVDEAQIPREYLKVDEQKLNLAARIAKDQAKVPGVRFYAEATVATRIDR